VQAAVTIPSQPDVALAGQGDEDFIEVEVRPGDVALLSLVGEHDIASQARLSEALEYATSRCKAVIVDLTSCTFAEMTVLGALVDCERRSRAQQQRLALVIPRDESFPGRLSRATRLASWMPVYDSVEAAERALGATQTISKGLQLSAPALRALRRGGPSSSLDGTAWEELGSVLVAGRPIAQKTRTQDGGHVWTLNAHGRRIREEQRMCAATRKRLVVPRV
jgi:anti-anti-sigma factor